MSKFQIDLLDKAYQGMGLSRYIGFEFMKCVDVDDYGVIKLNYEPVAQAVKATESFASLPFQIGYGRTSASAFKRFCIGSGFIKFWDESLEPDGWAVMAGVTPGTTTYNFGMGFYAGSAAKDYLIYPASTSGYLSALDCSSTASPSVSANFVTTLETGSLYKPFFTASNNKLYIGNSRYVAEIAENDGQTFAPGTAATFTLTVKKLKLGAQYAVSCFGEWNEYLVVGTKTPNNPTVSDLFLWDMVSPSFDRKISINVPGGVNAIVCHKNYIFIQAGDRGEWFVSAGGGCEKIAEIPQHLLPINTIVTIYPGGCAALGDRIYFGAETFNYSGIWSFDTRLLGESFDPVNRGVQPCQFEHIISTGEINNATIGGLQVVAGRGLIYGWYDQDGSTYGIDEINVSTSGQKVYNGSDGVIITRMYQLAGKNSKSLNSELYLAKPLKANESVLIYYRNNPNSSYTVATTAWVVDTAYSLDDVRLNNGRTYYCVGAHTSATATEPGVGSSWRTVWQESWKLYKTISDTDHLGRMIIDCPVIPAVDARNIQFMYILDTSNTPQTTGPELRSHILSE